MASGSGGWPPTLAKVHRGQPARRLTCKPQEIDWGEGPCICLPGLGPILYGPESPEVEVSLQKIHRGFRARILLGQVGSSFRFSAMNREAHPFSTGCWLPFSHGKDPYGTNFVGVCWLFNHVRSPNSPSSQRARPTQKKFSFVWSIDLWGTIPNANLGFGEHRQQSELKCDSGHADVWHVNHLNQDSLNVWCVVVSRFAPARMVVFLPGFF